MPLDALIDWLRLQMTLGHTDEVWCRSHECEAHGSTEIQIACVDMREAAPFFYAVLKTPERFD